MKKIFTLVAAVLFTASMFADSEIVPKASDNWTGVSASITNAECANGTSDQQKDGDESKVTYVKFRTNKNGNTLTLNVNDGYQINGVSLRAYSNNETSEIKLADVAYDGVAENLAPIAFPGSKAGTTATYAKNGLEVNTSVVFSFDNSAVVTSDDKNKNNQIMAVLEITYKRTATCTDPTIAWNVAPADGAVGATDFAASVTVPAAQTVVWTSSVPEVATVSEEGMISYKGAGITTITASYNYDGDEYCKKEASISKNIIVPISYTEAGANDNIWYYETAVPSSKPDNGLNYGETTTGNSMFGIKLNSSGYAWFEKAEVAGTLRIGAYYKSANTLPYDVYVYACDNAGAKQGKALDSLTISHAGAASAAINIEKDVKGIRIERKTPNEAVLYFVEFKASSATGIDNFAIEGKAVKVIRDGQVMILRDGKMYNALGVEVK